MTDTDIYGKPCNVVGVRTMLATNTELGVGLSANDAGHSAYFVYDRLIGDDHWHMHCGPYVTFDEAADWIRALRANAELVLKGG